MSEPTPQELGFLYEEEFASDLGIEIVKGSGNKWFAKLDCNGFQMMWSLKHTTKETFTINKALLREAINAATGPGGEGGNTLPGWAVKVAGESLVIMRQEDLLQAFTEDRKFARQSKADAKRVAAKIPVLLRED